MPPKLFSFTHFRKNASATPLVSHTFKTKDLKPFPFTHFQKKGRGWVPLSNMQPQTSHLRSSLSDHPTRMVVPSERSEPRDLSLRLNALDSALTLKRAAKSFTSNTYEKHTQGEGSPWGQNTNHESPVTNHESRTYPQSSKALLGPE